MSLTFVYQWVVCAYIYVAFFLGAHIYSLELCLRHALTLLNPIQTGNALETPLPLPPTRAKKVNNVKTVQGMTTKRTRWSEMGVFPPTWLIRET